MKKRLVCLLLSMLTLLSYPLLVWAFEVPAAPAQSAPVRYTRPAVPAETAAPETADETASAPEEPPAEEVSTEEASAEAVPAVACQFPVYVSGQAVVNAHSVLDGNTTYVSVLHVTQALCPEVQYSWAGGNAEVVYQGAGFTMSVKSGRSYLVCNERYLYIPGGARLHPEDGDLLVPVRTLAKALGAGLDVTEDGVYLTPGTPLEPGSTFYNATDLDLISRVVQHESGNQPLAGKIAVAQCILNRVKAGSRGGFANTVSGVIYQKGQFPGATNATPRAEAILAAKLAMDGADVVGNAKWFNGVGQPCWASKNKRLIANIGGHSFYG